MCMKTSPTERTSLLGRKEYLSSGAASARASIFFSRSASAPKYSFLNAALVEEVFAAESCLPPMVIAHWAVAQIAKVTDKAQASKNFFMNNLLFKREKYIAGQLSAGGEARIEGHAAIHEQRSAGYIVRFVGGE